MDDSVSIYTVINLYNSSSNAFMGKFSIDKENCEISVLYEH